MSRTFALLGSLVLIGCAGTRDAQDAASSREAEPVALGNAPRAESDSPALAEDSSKDEPEGGLGISGDVPVQQHDAKSKGQVNGRLPVDLIKKVVLEHHGAFRACYQAGLGRDPELAGRVTVRFVIARDGSVSAAGDGGSDISDPEVIECVLRAFRKIEFPEPEGGIIRVNYPIQFSPEGRRDGSVD